MSASAAAASWDAEYARGRYRDEPPVGFTHDIIGAATARGLTQGLYIGCGNGRNLVPLLAAGLDLTGLDISARAIGQLRRRRPDRGRKLIVGDLAALPHWRTIGSAVRTAGPWFLGRAGGWPRCRAGRDGQF